MEGGQFLHSREGPRGNILYRNGEVISGVVVGSKDCLQILGSCSSVVTCTLGKKDFMKNLKKSN